ncbi:MAG: NADH-quinone oxidoreductase subunit L [Deltaproteobacteria bacterium]|nr:NADH-quinone oxidoreductase subunit L [Deltaproteobacteria bacterium]
MPVVAGPAPTLWNLDVRSVEAALYWIPLIPMIGALFNALFGWRIGKGNIAFVACASVGASFLLALMCFGCVFPEGAEHTVLFQNVFTWFAVPAGASGPGIHIDLAYAVDRFSSILLLIITGVGFLIHVYSISYMSEERAANFARYFAYLNLFVGMMLTLVMGANLVVLFVGWEGVGLASYLLIGFWWDDEQKAAAGRKAFVVNRIGDFGFILGIFTLLATVGTVDMYAQPQRNNEGYSMAAQTPLQNGVNALAKEEPGTHAQQVVNQGPFRNARAGWVLTLAALLLFLGACGKSAQIPLYVWLPDAMAGPTPVSALIHAATMVTAGVYMLSRLNYLVVASPTAMMVIAFIGALTALFAAIIGTMQDDIKKVLAYSTVSQLGYMILGCGLGAFWAASLHLTTHAFFKACLFLGAGSVMHAMANETNIKKLGGLRKDIPITHATFLIATIAITGVFPLSGFFSKDDILDLAKNSNWPAAQTTGTVLYLIGTAGALCTAYYMARAYLLTFWGERRSLKDHHAHEAPLMTYPLVVLALFSIGAAVWGIPGLGKDGGTLWNSYLEPIFGPAHDGPGTLEANEGIPWGAWTIALIIAWAGAGFSYWVNMLRLSPTDLAAEQPVGNFAVRLIRNKFYVDEIYDVAFVKPIKGLAFYTWKFIDQFIIDGVLVGGWGFLTSAFAGILRAFQNGSAQRYAAVMAIALVVILLASPARDYLTALFGH